MRKFRKLEIKDLANDSLHRWLTYFDEQTDESIIKELMNMDVAIQKTNERLNFLSQDKEFLHRANLRDIALSDYTTAINDAKNEGREEAEAKYKNEIAELKAEIERLKNNN
ncbi:MAG: hypothetical protein FWG34_14115 [Oscillospiraceae bacterium]|jgi:flagellar biosynthesis/type III secretory pathway protein FliH|nr:hypothetical protein [Oscillospiraceae bacterium]